MGGVINLIFGAGGVQNQGHQLEVVLGLAEVGALLGIAVRIVGV